MNSVVHFNLQTNRLKFVLTQISLRQRWNVIHMHVRVYCKPSSTKQEQKVHFIIL